MSPPFHAGARGYLLCNPHNPTGRVFGRAELERIAALARRYDVVVVSDENHAPLTLPGAVHARFVALGKQLLPGPASAGVKLTLNGRDITPEYVTDLWVDGYYFHNDQGKRNALKGLLSDVGPMVRLTFMDFLVEGTRQVLYVRNMIGIAQREGFIDA